MKAGWTTTKLMDQCSVITKGTTPTSIGHKFTTSGPNFIKIESITQAGTFITSKFANISFDAHEALKRSQLKQGDILFSIAGALGRTAIVDATILPANTNQALAIIRLTDEPHFYKEYLRYFFTSELMIEQIEKLKGGAAQQNLSLTQLKELQIPLPPLEEQKRIVSILDEAFEGLDRARENAEANLKSAQELFERQLMDYFSITPNDWTSQKLKSITTKIGSGATPRGGADAYKAEGISLIRSLNVHDRWFKVDKLAYIDDGQAEKLSNVVVQEGDVLLNITGASIARCCVVPSEYLPARVNQHVSIIRPNRSALIPNFLAFMLTSKPYKDRLLKTGEDNGSTRQALTKSQIQDLEVTFPIETMQQEEAVLTLKAAGQKTRLLSDAFQAKLQDISDLRQSLLQKAFTGELT